MTGNSTCCGLSEVPAAEASPAKKNKPKKKEMKWKIKVGLRKIISF
jgi:hypothetical protein